MTMRRVERGQLFLGTELVATCTDFDIDIDTGDEQGDATDGSSYHLIGNSRTGLSLEMIVPADGSGENVRVNQAVANHEDLVLTGAIGGQIGHCDGFFKSVKYKSQAKSGSLNATGTLMGAEWTFGPPT